MEIPDFGNFGHDVHTIVLRFEFGPFLQDMREMCVDLGLGVESLEGDERPDGLHLDFDLKR